MQKIINIEQVRLDAEEIYQSGELLCAEAIVHSIIKNVDPDMPQEMMRAATPFSLGVGGSQCMCSTVSAAVLCLGYYFGRSFPTTLTDPDSLKTLELAFELQESFRNENRVLCCKIIRGKDADLGEPSTQCVGYVGDMAARTAEIIARELKLELVA